MERTSWRPATGPEPVWVDFNYMPSSGVIGLSAPITLAELERRGIKLRKGLVLNVWDGDLDDAGNRDDLIATGHVERWDDRWCLILEAPVRHQSDDPADAGA
jgi:hypothetical protein